MMAHSPRRISEVKPMLVVVLAALSVSPLACTSATASSPRLLTANVVDPNDVNQVSKFNSCEGHAYPEQNSPNSGKNYFWPNSTNFSTNTVLKEYAACDGTAGQTAQDQSADQQDRGRTLHLVCDNSSTRLRYFHVNFTSAVVGKHVSAGEFLGYASMVGTGQAPSQAWNFSSNFDIAVSEGDDRTTENYFSKLSPAALSAWGARGLTSPSQAIVPGNPTCAQFNPAGNAGVFAFTPLR
jgi:hypothetical protein